MIWQDFHQAGQTASHAFLWATRNWWEHCHFNVFTIELFSFFSYFFKGKTSTILACAKEIYSPQQFNSMVWQNLVWELVIPPNRCWSWTQVTTVASELWEARSSISLPPGPSSTSKNIEGFETERSSIFQGLQAHYSGRGGRHDKRCSKRSPKNNREIYWQC